jgi:hypothetical protein
MWKWCVSKASWNRLGASTPHLRTETYPVPGKFCSLEYRTTEKAKKLSNPELYTIVRAIKSKSSAISWDPATLDDQEVHGVKLNLPGHSHLIIFW